MYVYIGSAIVHFYIKNLCQSVHLRNAYHLTDIHDNFLKSISYTSLQNRNILYIEIIGLLYV